MHRVQSWWFAGILLANLLLVAGSASADLPPEDRIGRVERGSLRCQAGACAQDLEGQLALAVVLVEATRHLEALEALDVLDAIAPGDERSAYWRARALLGLGQTVDAEVALRGVVSARALALRGQLREERGDREMALADYRASAEIRATLELELAVARLAERTGREQLAIETLELAIRRTASALVRVEAARLADRLGLYDVALAHVDELIAIAPSVRWRVLRAAILADAGRVVEAEGELDRALVDANARVLRRGSALSLSERARVRVAMGELGLAREDLERATRLAPAWETARRQLGMLPTRTQGASR